MKQAQTGLSLIESIMIIAVIGTVVFLLANLPNSMKLINKSNHLSLAREIASKAIEDKRETKYANLVSGSQDLKTLDPRVAALLPSGSGTVVVADCDPVQNSSICPNGEHVKFVTATVNWKDNNKDQSVSLKTLIGEGGLNQ